MFRTHSFLLHLLEKLLHFLRLPILQKSCKLLIPCENVQLHCAWCRCSHFCCHPWQVLSVLKPESFLCLFLFEIGYLSYAYNQNSQDRADQPCFLQVPGINGIRRTEKDTLTFYIRDRNLSQHIAFTYLLQPTTITPPVQSTCKEFLPKF